MAKIHTTKAYKVWTRQISQYIFGGHLKPEQISKKKYEETWNTEYSFLKDRKVTTSGDWLIVN